MGRASAEQGLRNTCVGCGAAVIFTSVRGSSAIERLLHTFTVGRSAPSAGWAITGSSGPGGRWRPGERVGSTVCASPWKRSASKTRPRPWSAGIVVRGHGEPHRLGGRRLVAHGRGGDQLPHGKAQFWWLEGLRRFLWCTKGGEACPDVESCSSRGDKRCDLHRL